MQEKKVFLIFPLTEMLVCLQEFIEFNFTNPRIWRYTEWGFGTPNSSISPDKEVGMLIA